MHSFMQMIDTKDLLPTKNSKHIGSNDHSKEKKVQKIKKHKDVAFSTQSYIVLCLFVS